MRDSRTAFTTAFWTCHSAGRSVCGTRSSHAAHALDLHSSIKTTGTCTQATTLQVASRELQHHRKRYGSPR